MSELSTAAPAETTPPVTMSVASRALLRLTERSTATAVTPTDLLQHSEAVTLGIVVPAAAGATGIAADHSTTAVTDDDDAAFANSSSPYKVRRSIPKRALLELHTTETKSPSSQQPLEAPRFEGQVADTKKPYARPVPRKKPPSYLSETAAIIESEMGVGTIMTLEDLDLAAPMLLYSLSTSSINTNTNSNNKNRNKRKSTKEHREKETTGGGRKKSRRSKSPPSETEESSDYAATTAAMSKRAATSKRNANKNADRVIAAQSSRVQRALALKPVKTSKRGRSSNSSSSNNNNPSVQAKRKKSPAAKKKLADNRKNLASYIATKSNTAVGKSKHVNASKVQIDPNIKLPWPRTNAVHYDLTHHDVLSGRGNGIAIHPGNKNFRTLVQFKKQEYLAAYRLEKGLVAADVIRLVLSLKPPGRFVEKSPCGKGYVMVDFSKALEKTSQALREGTAYKTTNKYP